LKLPTAKHFQTQNPHPKIQNGMRAWLIYALGGGWGHLMRTLALGRIAALTRPVSILCNSPYATNLLRYVAADQSLPVVAGCYIHAIPSNASFAKTCEHVRYVVTSEEYECLVVDTFPRGLGGELADILPQIKAPRILVHRDINPDYVCAKDLQRFVKDNFDLVLVPGETGELPLAQLPQVEHTAPWLIENVSELPNRAGSRALLRLNPSSVDQVLLVCAAGRAEELSFYGQLTGKLANSLTGITVRCLSAECPEHCPPELWVFHWPGIECLPATNVVVGGAGYNTFSECVAVGVPLVAFAFPRRYDRQRMRVRRWYDRQQWPPVRLVESVEEALLAVSDCLQLLPCHQPNFINGTIASVHSIEKVIRA
jgi:hypothetical protein